jgi:ribosome biogenesis GTPase / thiamine phosphate phosphatase
VLSCGLKGEQREADLAVLRERMNGLTSLVLGPSGGGKSTFINALVPDASLQTAEISQALNSGKHTTTSTSWFAWNQAGHAGAVIDSPGFQEFGLHHIEATELAGHMPDLRAHLGHCKFHNCSHLHEPGCGVRSAVGGSESGAITPERHALYLSLHEELSQPPQW